PTVSVAANPQPAGDITIEELDAKYPEAEKAYFAGGCFWCTEAAFDRIQGVKDVWSGYTGGKEKNPNYRQVAYGETGHAESVVVYFDPEVVSYETLLDVFFVAHDPTQVNRQGPDIGAHYRSEIFYMSEEQEQAARTKIKALDASGKFKKPIATKISKAGYFYVAEDYHQDYFEDPSNPNQGYVQNVSRPKVEKVMKTFANILKPEFREKP
ncbi:MAG: peptide-methionine (S)-S-oxide reductase MsrA, partial [Bacteroidota bacterium]